MCEQTSIMMMLRVNIIFKLGAVIFLIATGSVLTADDNLQLAFGSHMIGLGVTAIIVGICLGPSTCLGLRGARQHSRFYLTVHVMLESLLLIVLVVVTIAVLAAMASTHDLELRLDCLRHEPKTQSSAMCQEYFRADRTAGMRLVWLNRFVDGRNSAAQYQILSQLQIQNNCCGFGPPLRCTPDSRPFPENRPARLYVPEAYSRQRNVCGPSEDHYVELLRDECVHVEDKTVVPPVVAGCRTDFPVGQCDDEVVEAATAGCAASMEKSMVDQIGVYAWGYIAVLLSMFASCVGGCALCWKRKRFDAIPNYIDDVPWDPYAGKKKGKPRAKRAADTADDDEDEDDDDDDDKDGGLGDAEQPPTKAASSADPARKGAKAKPGGSRVHP